MNGYGLVCLIVYHKVLHRQSVGEVLGKIRENIVLWVNRGKEYAIFQFTKTQKGVPSTLWIPMEGLGSAMITGAQSGNFDLAAQLKACVNAIEKKSV
mgnify:CR=1 FL=1